MPDTLVSRRIEPEGKLTVTASALFGRRYGAAIVFDFLWRHPKVSADVLFVDRVVNLIEKGVEVAVRIADIKVPRGDPGRPCWGASCAQADSTGWSKIRSVNRRVLR